MNTVEYGLLAASIAVLILLGVQAYNWLLLPWFQTLIRTVTGT